MLHWQQHDEYSQLLETIDTSGNLHTSDYLTTIVLDLIQKCKATYNCAVTSFVTGNVANMTSPL